MRVKFILLLKYHPSHLRRRLHLSVCFFSLSTVPSRMCQYEILPTTEDKLPFRNLQALKNVKRDALSFLVWRFSNERDIRSLRNGGQLLNEKLKNGRRVRKKGKRKERKKLRNERFPFNSGLSFRRKSPPKKRTTTDELPTGQR